MDDFNNDRQIDIVVANTGANNVAVLLGHKDGSFTIEATYRTGLDPYYVAVGDFNRDSRLDITVANEDNGNIGAIFGYVNCTFRNHATLRTGDRSRPSSFAIADLNHDQQKNIIVTNSESNSVGVFLGYGNGSFANQLTFSSGSYSYPKSVVVGDFNHDTQLDIVVANFGRNAISLFLGFGNGSFACQVTYSTGSYSYPRHVAICDFNNDLLLDIVVANYYRNNIGILLGQGNGTFLETPHPHSIHLVHEIFVSQNRICHLIEVYHPML
ncbi:unnamed protein product [Rotaria magnacalcarata]|uniref:Uncharacterized protein n=1 Tax=Rotaria magnacalcarata TaxID=392030 RepID=A0A819KSL3_9BILA|nr:unnamed protein product [Rotaria magnacalcarata]CAF3949991.1 unnamed protein product [Rotaria magnacalcarata]